MLLLGNDVYTDIPKETAISEIVRVKYRISEWSRTKNVGRGDSKNASKPDNIDRKQFLYELDDIYRKTNAGLVLMQNGCRIRQQEKQFLWNDFNLTKLGLYMLHWRLTIWQAKVEPCVYE